jgi:beta-glucosidase
MDSLGVNAYRFSISWSRILPRGRLGEVNQAGIMFYDRIINTLLRKGMEPFITIHHHDFPQELEDKYTAWLSPIMQEEFVYFSKVCFERFGDRVKNWISINEPNLFARMAYMWGWYPPGRCSPPTGKVNCSAGNSDVEPLTAMHNMLLAHAKATKLYHDQFQAKQGGWMGITVSSYMYEPIRSNGNEDEAAGRALAFNMAWMLDPLILGDYPPEMRHYHGDELPQFTEEEQSYLKGSLDFIGVNHYSTLYAEDCLRSSSCTPEDNRTIVGFVSTPGERDGVLIGPETGMHTFYVVPRGMKENVDYFAKRYGNIPMIITENGYSSIPEENKLEEELLHDNKRVEFHKSYLKSLASAIRNGADVRGYFAWSLMDNFEWIQGYELKFGLYYIEQPSLNRIPKLSAMWYKDFLTNNSTIEKQATAETKASAR